MLQSLLQNDVLVAAVASALTAGVLGLLYRIVGALGSALEAAGAARNMPSLVVLGKRLEAIGYDGPKLRGEQGAPETKQ